MKAPVLEMLLAMLLALPLAAAAEDDGNELLDFLGKPATREVAATYIDAAWTEWNDTLFCIPGPDRQKQAMDAVEAYLVANPDQLFRPRRYLIIQGLRAGYPCKP